MTLYPMIFTRATGDYYKQLSESLKPFQLVLLHLCAKKIPMCYQFNEETHWIENPGNEALSRWQEQHLME